MNDDNSQTNDDLQRDTGFFSPTRDEEVLAEDGTTPAAPADVDTQGMPQDYPTTDTDMDSGEVYLGGVADAAGYDVLPESGDDEVVSVSLEPEDEEDARS